jgi:hypothetical protein
MTTSVTSSSPARVVRALALFAILLSLSVSGLEAQLPSPGERVRTRPSIADEFAYRIATFSPASGPPGTTVAVKWEYLPAITPMRIGVGAQRVGFEVLKEVLSDDKGVFADTIKIPEWASVNRPVMLIVFDFYFNPLAISSAFQVTDANGLLVRTGRLQESTGGSSCVELLTTENDHYWLTGDTGAFVPGDRVVVQSRVGSPTACGRGERDVVLQVVSIRRGIGTQ